MYKPYLFLLLALCIFSAAHAQTTEFSVQANSGVSRFFGSGTTNATYLNGAPPTGYANGTGNSLALTYGINAQLQHVFKGNFILGVQTGFEQFSGRTNINMANGDHTTLFTVNTPNPNSQELVSQSATGHVTNHYDYINAIPYFGYRLNWGSTKFDIMPGFELGFGTGSSNYVHVKTEDGTVFNKSGYVQYTPQTQNRARLGLALYRKRFGITASYAYGITNQNSKVVSMPVYYQSRGASTDNSVYNPANPVHEELFRLGISYRLAGGIGK